MSFDQDGDAGTRRAISDALALIEAGDAWAATSIWMMRHQDLSKQNGALDLGASVNAWRISERAACVRLKGNCCTASLYGQ